MDVLGTVTSTEVVEYPDSPLVHFSGRHLHDIQERVEFKIIGLRKFFRSKTAKLARISGNGLSFTLLRLHKTEVPTLGRSESLLPPEPVSVTN